MLPEDDSLSLLKQRRAATIAKETGVTLDEAMVLIEMIGMDLSSLLREARILQRSRSRGLS